MEPKQYFNQQYYKQALDNNLYKEQIKCERIY